MNRTVAELLYGSAAFQPISARERMWWRAFLGQEVKEREEAESKGR